MDYNTQRPRGPLAHLTPCEYVAQQGYLPTSHCGEFLKPSLLLIG